MAWNYDELITDLREEAEWAKANEWETPIMLSDHLTQASDAIEDLTRAVAVMEIDRDAERKLREAAEEHIAELSRRCEQFMYMSFPAWNSVKDVPPPLDEVVLITDGVEVGTGYVSDRYGWLSHFDDIDKSGITHWMPRPLPYKEKTK